MSCPSARKVLVPAADAGLEADAAAVPLDELQAVTSKAAHASDVQPATCRALRAFVVTTEFLPLNVHFP
jgi:hypothetical protein